MKRLPPMNQLTHEDVIALQLLSESLLMIRNIAHSNPDGVNKQILDLVEASHELPDLIRSGTMATSVGHKFITRAQLAISLNRDE
ncbi:TPA: hypothetical protein MW242_003097 [Acinetobacter baumannii]|nr:hypothetical protein [Acinetobacter baumannii]